MWRNSLNREMAAVLAVLCGALLQVACGDFNPLQSRPCAPLQIVPEEIGLTPGDPATTVTAGISRYSRECYGAENWIVDTGPEVSLKVVSSNDSKATISVQANKPPAADSWPWHPTGAYEEVMAITADCGPYLVTGRLKVYVAMPYLKATRSNAALTRVDETNYTVSCKMQWDVLNDKSTKQYSFEGAAKLEVTGLDPLTPTVQRDSSSAKSASFTITHKFQVPSNHPPFVVEVAMTATARAGDSPPLQGANRRLMWH